MQWLSYLPPPRPTAASSPQRIVTGPDGALWVTLHGINRVGRITTAGVITEPVQVAGGPWGLARGSAVRRFTPQGATPPPANVSLTVSARGRTGERVSSSPAGINVLVGSTGSASFAADTAITLSLAGGRGAVWSGACSSGGSKTRSCAFRIKTPPEAFFGAAGALIFAWRRSG